MDLLKKVRENGLTYEGYKKKINSYLNTTDSDTLSDEERERFGFTKLNQQRISRVEKTYQPSEEVAAFVKSIPSPQTWMVLTEGWCGDSAVNMPVFAKVASLSPAIDFVLIERDANPDIMDQFLTNGARGIPKMVAFNENGEVLFTWGTRPAAAQELVVTLKGQGMPKSEWEEKLHLWYAKNRGKDVDQELLEKLKSTAALNAV